MDRIKTMNRKRIFMVGVCVALGFGAFIGIESATVSPNNGPSYSEMCFLLPGQKPKMYHVEGGGVRLSKVRYAYGLLPGGFMDPSHLEVTIEERGAVNGDFKMGGIHKSSHLEVTIEERGAVK